MTDYEFEIVTDSCSSLSEEITEKYGLYTIPLVYRVNGEEKLGYVKGETPDLKKFYDSMRDKTPMTTSCAPREECEKIFEEVLSAGKDLLYVGFSSALSVNFDMISGILAEFKEKYPERKIIAVDTHTGSLGEGALVIFAANLRENGENIESVAEKTENGKQKLVSLFTVENLAYLYRGGRLKKTTFLIASTLNIKPIIRADENGKLVPVGKVFGRKISLSNLAQRVADNIADAENATLYVAHADCPDDAEFLISKIKEKINVSNTVINYIDVVMGVHCGPGTVAVFFFGK